MSQTTQEKRRIAWYRTKIDRNELARLNQRSNFLGGLQTVGYLSTLAATGALAWWTTLNQPWYWWIPAFFLHGTCYAFIINGFHWLNVFFCMCSALGAGTTRYISGPATPSTTSTPCTRPTTAKSSCQSIQYVPPLPAGQ
jgi:hypothetical protein